MIAFTPLRTRRLSVQLKELSIGDAIYLCALRPDMLEAGTTELLQRIVEHDERPRVGQVTDVRLWTVQERLMAVAHYLLHIGGDDFAIGEDARFSDYLRSGEDFPPVEVAIGAIEGDQWALRPLLGVHSEAIERLILAGEIQAKRQSWRLGAMAAQLVRAGETIPDPTTVSDSELEDWIKSRVKVLLGYPESVFLQLIAEFERGMPQLDHLFSITFLEDGIAALPQKAGADLPSARFPFHTAIAERTTQLFGKPR